MTCFTHVWLGSSFVFLRCCSGGVTREHRGCRQHWGCSFCLEERVRDKERRCVLTADGLQFLVVPCCAFLLLWLLWWWVVVVGVRPGWALLTHLGAMLAHHLGAMLHCLGHFGAMLHCCACTQDKRFEPTVAAGTLKRELDVEISRNNQCAP